MRKYSIFIDGITLSRKEAEDMLERAAFKDGLSESVERSINFESTRNGVHLTRITATYR